MILRRIEGERFSEVLPAWTGGAVVILAGGPSLTMEQVNRAASAHYVGRASAIVVNDAYLVAPWADVHYAADSHWHRWHTEGIEKPALGLSAAEVRARWVRFGGQKASIQSSGGNISDAAVHILRNRDFPAHSMGLSEDPRALVTGRNSGFQALNLAVLAGAKTILLVGFDGAPAADGRGHFHGGHPRLTPAAAYPLYRQAMDAAAPVLCRLGVRVLNCSPGSAIAAFPAANLEDVL